MITTNNKDLSSIINSMHLPISEYCFSNIFCFQQDHNFMTTKIDDLLFIKGHHSHIEYLMPLFVPTEQSVTRISDIMIKGLSLYPLPKEWVHVFSKNKCFDINSYEKDFDYVFSRGKLANMSGRKLSKKRNLISQFLRNCSDIKIMQFQEEHQKDALSLLEKWTKEASDDKNNTDYNACLLGIKNFKTLNLKGAVVYSSDKLVGFTLGETINDYYMLHFAKADIHCKGAYQFLFQKTAQQLHNINWINFEQDLGKPELKKMKSSYYPDKVIKKYTVSLTSTH